MKHLFLSCLCHESQGLCDWKPSSVSSRTWSTCLSAQDSPAIMGGNEDAKFSPTLWTSSKLFPPPSVIPLESTVLPFLFFHLLTETNRLSAISPAKLGLFWIGRELQFGVAGCPRGEAH